MAAKGMPEAWWQNLPCHFHPSWGLDEIKNLDLQQLKHKAQNHAKDLMVVEHKIYQAFLEYPCGKFFNNKRPSLANALNFLQQADQYITDTLRKNNEARIGYGIVINCFRMWKDTSRVYKYKDQLKALNEEKEKFPKHEHYIFAIRAYSLSRLGPKWIEESQKFFDKALKGYPDNCQWLFGKALMLGRRSRLSIGKDGWTKDALKKNEENLKLEKDILQTILQKEPDNSLVKVYIGEVLLLLGESEDAELYIKLALECSQNDAKVAVKAGSVYRKLGKLDVAEDILKNQLTRKETAEAHFQLGLIKKDHLNTEDTNQREEYLSQALVHFTKGHDIDPAHVPCLTRKAEMTAKFGHYVEAKIIFTDIFVQEVSNMLSAGDSLYVYTVAVNLDQRLLKEVFDMDQIVNIYYKFLTLCTSPERSKFMDELNKISKNKNDSPEIQQYASFKLAELQRRFGSYSEAISHYKQLLDVQNGEEGLVNGSVIRTGLTLTTAKERLNQGIADKEDLQKIYSMVSSTIEQGSLEGSYIFAMAAEKLSSFFFDIKFAIPRTLAMIKFILDKKVDILHADFEVKGDNKFAEMIHIDVKQDLIRKLVEQFCNYDAGLADKMQTEKEELLQKGYNSLQGLRRKRLNFELELIKAHIDGKSWNDTCAHTASPVLQQSREILDHAIHLYQIEVLQNEPGRSIFPIHFDWKQASVDKETTKKKLRGWCASAFPEYSMPPDVFEHLLQVQPMYDGNNLWLAALGSFSSTEKHKCYQTSETFLLKLKDETKPPIYIAISEIIEKSNYEVERLSLFFMEKCKEIENYTGETTCSLLEPVTNLTLNENDCPELPQGTPASFR